MTDELHAWQDVTDELHAGWPRMQVERGNIVKGMVQQEWGEMEGGGEEEERNKGKRNNDDNDNDAAAVAVAIAGAIGAIEEYGLPCADNCLPKTSATIEDDALPHAKSN